jgi:hypothetical protein
MIFRIYGVLPSLLKLTVLWSFRKRIPAFIENKLLDQSLFENLSLFCLDVLEQSVCSADDDSVFASASVSHVSNRRYRQLYTMIYQR